LLFTALSTTILLLFFFLGGFLLRLIVFIIIVAIAVIMIMHVHEIAWVLPKVQVVLERLPHVEIIEVEGDLHGLIDGVQ